MTKPLDRDTLLEAVKIADQVWEESHGTEGAGAAACIAIKLRALAAQIERNAAGPVQLGPSGRERDSATVASNPTLLPDAPVAPAAPLRLLDVRELESRLRRNPLISKFLDQGFWHAHHVDIVIRYNGKDCRYEADWIKDLWYLVIRGPFCDLPSGVQASSPAPAAPDERRP
jgi:hypothetical protein